MANNTITEWKVFLLFGKSGLLVSLVLFASPGGLAVLAAKAVAGLVKLKPFLAVLCLIFEMCVKGSRETAVPRLLRVKYMSRFNENL